ncbi:hypothetical protein HQ529_04145 [Candidatus Woesearchaeota archaeon]|nr:hypothetical protein [Candidatus Woesearchaeota archaeon]
MNIKKILPILPLFFVFLVEEVKAHCPLCTIGAAAAAGGAVWLGVNQVVIGIFIGAFAVSIGWWVAGLIKKQYVPFQKWIIILLSFITTIGPLLPILDGVNPLYISLAGEYGSLLNRVYLYNLFLIGSIIGGIIVSLTPWLSKKITELRKGKMISYQGIMLTLLLLVITGIIIQLVI